MAAKPLSKSLITAWQETVIELSRLSKKDKQDPDRSAMIRKLVRIEKAALLRLREVFTTERESIDSKLLGSKENLISYLLGFHLHNAYRLLKTLERVQQRHNWSALTSTPNASLSVWDLGCGSGALSQVVVDTFAPYFATQRAYLYDTHSPLLDASKRIFARLALPNLRVFPRKVSLQELNTQPQIFPDELTVVGLGYVWNELTNNKKAQSQIRELLQHFLVNKAQVLLIVQEPAQDSVARSAMELRNQLVQQGFVPLYPCPHQHECPMLKRSKDWCYSEFATDEMSHDARLVDQFLEIDRTLIAASSYVFASPQLQERLKRQTETPPVVVGRPQNKESRSFSYLLCNPDGELTKQERELIAARGDVKWRGDEF